MAEPLPMVLVPGLLTSPRLYAEQLPSLWRLGPVTIAGNTRDDTLAAIASRILAAAPPRFALTGLSMGGYGTWDLIARFPDRFAAAVPICGGGDPKTASQIKHIPIWAFHGALDSVVPPGQSRMAGSVRRCRPSCCIERPTMRQLTGRTIGMSPSRLEREFPSMT